MPRRDSDGQFVSSPDYNEMTGITASISMTIPAADLAGGTQAEGVWGDETEIVDFTPILDNDEVYELHHMEGTALCAMPTTATAEGDALIEYAYTRDFDIPSGVMSGTSTFFGASAVEEGIVDINASGADDEQEVLHGSHLWSTPSAIDSVNGTGAGSDLDRERFEKDFVDRYGSGPAFDADDEIAVPTWFHLSGISDHAVAFQTVVNLRGEIVEV